MNPIEKNILKLMRATLGEVEFTDAVQNRISQRLNVKRKAAAVQAFSEQLPLFPEIDLLEKQKPAIETELEVANFLWDFPFTIVVSEEISPEQQVESEKLSPSQLLLPGFESHFVLFHQAFNSFVAEVCLLRGCFVPRNATASDWNNQEGMNATLITTFFA